jgi:hypothetical protein
MTAATDLWQLGVVLYWLLFAELPYTFPLPDVHLRIPYTGVGHELVVPVEEGTRRDSFGYLINLVKVMLNLF